MIRYLDHLATPTTGTRTFPLIADGLQTSDVLPSLQEQEHFPSSRTDYRLLVCCLALQEHFIADGLQTFEVLSRRSA
ncbi:hypothetical protein TNCV_197551 [Trichonephila clavipes]|uniref:Uncharacterized protein n=1 Tax=Trichonephila clavipes TaxID=2585209 RepID=A0A8X6V0Q9_TRICX|nr:hypothetical protein TNCV_197551 [Trichonephila clavipes]